ncbi:MAG: HlyD family secretion protein [Candidatus Melainabacteria bacterium]|jgi:HlyD family secretion protein
MKQESPTSKPQAKTIKPIFIIAPIAIALIGFLIFRSAYKQYQDGLTVSGTVQASEVQFGSRQSGRVSEVLAKEGQVLKKGDVIVLLEAKELENQKDSLKAKVNAQNNYLAELKKGNRVDQIQASKSNYQSSKAQYELVKAGNRKEEINSARSAKESSESELKTAKNYYERRQTLFEKELISREQLDDAQNKFKTAEKRLEEANENYKKISAGYRKEEIDKAYQQMKSQESVYLDLGKGTRPEKIEAENNQLKVYEAQLAELETKLAELQVTSPCNCELSDFEIEPGTLVLQNQVLGTLIDLDDIWVNAYLPEEVYGKVKNGDKVEVLSMTYPSEKLSGTVRHISLKAEFTPRNIQTIEGRKQQVFKVKIALDNTERLYRPGMDLDMKFKFAKSN